MIPVAPEVFQHFFETSPQAMWAYELNEGRFLVVNDAACQRYGYSREEFSRMGLADIRPSRDVAHLLEVLHRTRDEGRSSPPGIWEHRTKSGESIWVEVLSTVVEIEGQRAGFAVLRDVTRETQLRSERNRLFEISQDIMSVRELDGTLIEVNAAVERILGWTPEEYKRLSVADLMHEDDRFQPFAPVSPGHGEESIFRLVRGRAKDGTYRWLHWVQTVDVEAGRRYSVVRDVTEEREMFERLRRNERNLSLAQRVSHVGSWAYDVLRERVEVSDELCRLLDRDPQDDPPTWDAVLSQIHPADRHLLNVVRDPSTPNWSRRQFNVRILRPNGEIRVADCLLEVGGEVDGTITYYHGTMQDITVRMKAEETQRWLAEIVSSSTEAIVGKTLDGTVLSWNRAAEQLYGYSEQEMLGQSIRAIFPKHREEELETILARVRQGDRIEEFETERCNRHGQTIEVAVNISPVKTEAGHIVGAAAVTRDITAKKASERQLANRLAQITALHKIDQSIATTFELSETLQVVAIQTLSTTDVEAIHLFGLDPVHGRETLLAARERGQSPGKHLRDETSHAMARVALAERNADATTTSFSLRSGLCEARLLITKGEVRGVFVVHHRAASERTADQARFLDALAGHAAIAIETVDLFRDLQASHDDLKSAYDETLEGWSRALDLRDHETEGHSRRVTDLTMHLAAKLGIEGEDLVNVRRGALLHDIGKLGVPDRILLKPGPLDDSEWEIMRKHPLFGRDLLAPVAFLRPALDIPLYHHEKWDGSGYPVGLAGEAIPLPARIFALADVWDALTWPRPYREAWHPDRVTAYIREQSGRHFDPSLVEEFLQTVCDLFVPEA